MTESHYKNFQLKLSTKKSFRYFWQFWANYAFVFFAIATAILVTSPAFQSVVKPIFAISVTSFLIARGMVVFGINLLYKKKRPYQLFNFAPITSRFFSWQTQTPNAFPSRHTTAYFSVAIVFALFIPALGAALIGVAIMAGIARVILGFHWPVDIVAGAVVGAVIAILSVYFAYPLIFT